MLKTFFETVPSGNIFTLAPLFRLLKVLLCLLASGVSVEKVEVVLTPNPWWRGYVLNIPALKFHSDVLLDKSFIIQ